MVIGSSLVPKYRGFQPFFVVSSDLITFLFSKLNGVQAFLVASCGSGADVSCFGASCFSFCFFWPNKLNGFQYFVCAGFFSTGSTDFLSF